MSERGVWGGVGRRWGRGWPREALEECDCVLSTVGRLLRLDDPWMNEWKIGRGDACAVLYLMEVVR